MRPRIWTSEGTLARPFVYPVRLVDRLERRYEEDRSRRVPIRWFQHGYVVSVDPVEDPWFPAGADTLGRDVLSRLLYGARLSLGVAALASVGALALGLLIGGVAGFTGGRVDRLLMGIADAVVVLPAIYVVLAARAALPLVLSTPQVFGALTLLLTLAGWPIVARGVRAIVATERRKEYAEAALAMGAGASRILLHHLLPATRTFLVSLWLTLLPAFILAEATLSFVGLGFPLPTATWGAMLREGWQAGAIMSAPWLMAPAVAIVITVFSLHLITHAEHSPERQAGTFS
jgi:peptide/nickel transport system permease protein